MVWRVHWPARLLAEFVLCRQVQCNSWANITTRSGSQNQSILSARLQEQISLACPSAVCHKEQGFQPGLWSQQPSHPQGHVKAHGSSRSPEDT